MNDVRKKYLLCLGILFAVITIFIICGHRGTTYRYDNEAVHGIEIKKMVVYDDKIVLKFANNSLSQVGNVRCYGDDFLILEREAQFSFRGNTLTIETENADMISGITVRADNDLYFNVRYLDSDSYAMLVYAWEAYDIGYVEYGDESAYNTQEENVVQEARLIALADAEEIAYSKLLGTWINESETVRVEFSYTGDEFYKELTVYELAGDEWGVERTIPITSASEQDLNESVQITLYDNPSYGYAYTFNFYNDYTEMECEFSDGRFVKVEPESSEKDGNTDNNTESMIAPSKDEVIAMRAVVLDGMSEEEIERLTENIKVANLTMESAYLNDNLFGKLEDADSPYWQYFDKTGEIQVGWWYNGYIIQKDAIMQAEGITETEFYDREYEPGMAYNRFDAANFIALIEDMQSSVQNEMLSADLQQLIDLTYMASVTHEMEYANQIYKILHDLDYFLLRYGIEDVGAYTQNSGTVAQYYGVLTVYGAKPYELDETNTIQ